jgi:hypothetical protein
VLPKALSSSTAFAITKRTSCAPFFACLLLLFPKEWIYFSRREARMKNLTNTKIVRWCDVKNENPYYTQIHTHTCAGSRWMKESKSIVLIE